MLGTFYHRSVVLIVLINYLITFYNYKLWNCDLADLINIIFIIHYSCQ